MVNQKTALKQLSKLSHLGKQMRLAAEQWPSEFQILIATILSARTRDEKTILVAKKLFQKFPSSNKLASASLKDVQKIIMPVNFYKNKSKNIINCSKKLIEFYREKIPKEIDELLKLPGVGRKTANVFLSEIGNDAIGVDTHVQYISKKLRWTKNKNPEKIEEDLKKLFQQKYWNKVNPTLVRFGRTYSSKKQKDKILDELSLKK